jgi:NTE family protein
MGESQPAGQARIALALSGGGSRAIAFHLGCLRALQKAGVLEQVETISSVSGGSVIAGLYCSHRGDFASFDTKVLGVLKSGLLGPALRVAFTTTEGLKALAAFLLFAADWARIFVARWVAWPLPAQWYEFLQKPLIRQLASRTTILRRVFDQILEGAHLTDLRDDRPRLIVVACELRARAAFYFTKLGCHCWRYGRLVSGEIKLSQAVSASSAYPIFLPVLDEQWEFEKNGSKLSARVQLTDGGVYDNLGLAPFWPGRDPAISAEVAKPDVMIVCRAGYALEVQPPTGFWYTRIVASTEAIHARAENLALNRLFNLRNAGNFEKVILAFLGQDDAQLKHVDMISVGRADALAYPTNFWAMDEDWIERLVNRGEQVMAAVLKEYWGPAAPPSPLLVS